MLFGAGGNNRVSSTGLRETLQPADLRPVQPVDKPSKLLFIPFLRDLNFTVCG